MSGISFTTPRLEEAVGENGSVATHTRFTVFKSCRASALLRISFGYTQSILLKAILCMIFQTPSVPSSVPGWATKGLSGSASGVLANERHS